MIINDFRINPITSLTMEGEEMTHGFEIEASVTAEEGEVLNPHAWSKAISDLRREIDSYD